MQLLNMLRKLASVLLVNGLLGMCVVRYIKSTATFGSMWHADLLWATSGWVATGMLLLTGHVFAAAMLTSCA